jgi:hypothetical protein
VSNDRDPSDALLGALAMFITCLVILALLESGEFINIFP